MEEDHVILAWTQSTAKLVTVFAAAYLVVSAPLAASEIETGRLVASIFLGAVLIVLSIIDIQTFRLPDALTIGLTGSGLLCAHELSLDPDLRMRVIAAIFAFLAFWLVDMIYVKLRHRHGLGLGDAKLFAAAAAWVGPSGLSWVILIACISALAALGMLALSGRPVLDRRIAFGPFLSAGLWVVWLYGPIF